MAYSNDPLSAEEKEVLREYICSGSRIGVRAVTPSFLANIASKSPAEIRELVAKYREVRAKAIQDNIAKLQNDLTKYNS